MALNAYLAQVESLLDDFGNVEYTTANLTTYINDARVQIAGASESIRAEAVFDLAAGTQSYPFSVAITPNSASSGIAGLLSVRMTRLTTSDGFAELEMRPWEWFYSYYLCAPTTASGVPAVCAEFQPGIGGVLYFSPIPNANMVAFANGVCYPIALVTDSTVEALSAPWTEAVQYYAAYLALLNAQRRTDADAMFARYSTFETRATQMTTPTRLPRNYPGGRAARLAGQNMPITTPPAQPQGGGGG